MIIPLKIKKKTVMDQSEDIKKSLDFLLEEVRAKLSYLESYFSLSSSLYVIYS